MSNKVKELFKKLKESFDAPPAPDMTSYKLSDGTEVLIDKLEAGGKVMVGTAPAAAGTYVLEDTSSITVDENGLITVVTPVAAVADPNAVDLTKPEGIQALYAKFATGTPEDRIANMETMMKAVFEYCFGWQLREAQSKADQAAAIKTYTDSIATTQQAVTAQEGLMRQMLALMGEIVDAPTSDAPEPRKKFSFSNTGGKNKSLEKFQAAAAKLAEEAKENMKVA